MVRDQERGDHPVHTLSQEVSRLWTWVGAASGKREGDPWGRSLGLTRGTEYHVGVGSWEYGQVWSGSGGPGSGGYRTVRSRGRTEEGRPLVQKPYF